MPKQIEIRATPVWHAAMPGAVAGLMTMTDLTIDPGLNLDSAREALVSALRQRFAGFTRAELRVIPPLPAYERYYSRFKQTYHVLLQCESVALKGKSLPRRPPLVEAMFLAELDSLLLTAGHDLNALSCPLAIDIAGADERYVGIGGKPETCRPGDMLMRDAEGVTCSIIQGPDNRTSITSATTDALFVVYAPPGIGPDPVIAHLNKIAANVQLVAPNAQTRSLVAIEASSTHQ